MENLDKRMAVLRNRGPKTWLMAVVGLILLLILPFQSTQAQHRHLGNVDFPVSCSPDAARTFATGLALLHHMMYEQAEEAFASAAREDPACAIAHWGVAMTLLHPLWPGQPSEQALQKGQAALAQARALNAPTERERAYVAAAEAFYTDWQTVGHAARIAAWETAQEAVYRAYPDDVEAGAFYALAHLATAPKADNTFAHQKTAGALLEDLLARAPEHPGLFHYTIHAYDNPMLASRAVDVARGYDKLAPDVPHALHMPTHIFVRLGLWPDVIDWNVRSAEVAWRQPVGEATSMHHVHALDYLMYAYLQQGRDKKARAVLDQVNAVDNYQATAASAYGIAAAQARYVLERGRWADAAALAVRTHRAFPWDRFPWFEAMTYFARGLGAARSDGIAAAQAAIETLDAFYEQTTQAGQPYWAVLVDAQRKTVAAWVALAEGDTDQALSLMRAAADLEDSVDKHPVTPGAVLPARELLGDMLALSERPEEALAAYETSLKTSPNRFNSLYGAGRSAELAGDTHAAASYYQKLVAVTTEADATRERLDYARSFLAAK